MYVEYAGHLDLHAADRRGGWNLVAAAVLHALESHSIHAKTGTLGRAIALSGYAESKTRGWLAFSILVNDFAAAPSEIQQWIDKIALALVDTP